MSWTSCVLCRTCWGEGAGSGGRGCGLSAPRLQQQEQPQQRTAAAASAARRCRRRRGSDSARPLHLHPLQHDVHPTEGLKLDATTLQPLRHAGVRLCPLMVDCLPRRANPALCPRPIVLQYRKGFGALPLSPFPIGCLGPTSKLCWWGVCCVPTEPAVAQLPASNKRAVLEAAVGSCMHACKAHLAAVTSCALWMMKPVGWTCVHAQHSMPGR